MKVSRVVAVFLLSSAAVLVGASPARAGGWATTVLDPLPSRLEIGRTYTVGYWVLQHGSHPYEGDIGKTGLRLTDDAGKSVLYNGAALPEAAHYAASVVFPRAGTWRVSSVQGVFAEYEVGSITVPGSLRVEPTPRPMPATDGHSHWGAIHPPVAAPVQPEPPPARSTGPIGSEAAPPARSRGQAPLVGSLAIAAALLLAAGWKWRSRSHPSTTEPSHADR